MIGAAVGCGPVASADVVSTAMVGARGVLVCEVSCAPRFLFGRAPVPPSCTGGHTSTFSTITAAVAFPSRSLHNIRTAQS